MESKAWEIDRLWEGREKKRRKRGRLVTGILAVDGAADHTCPQEERESPRPELCSATYISPSFLTVSSVPEPISQGLPPVLVSICWAYLISIHLDE